MQEAAISPVPFGTQAQLCSQKDLSLPPHPLSSLSKLPNLEQEKEIKEGCKACLP